MHIFVRAYRDSDGNGEGDIAGIIEKLDYLRDLGIRGILLLPIFPSQDRDSGYLTTNYRDVAPDYGSLEDLDRLIAVAHARGIGIVLDDVLQASSGRGTWCSTGRTRRCARTTRTRCGSG